MWMCYQVLIPQQMRKLGQNWARTCLTNWFKMSVQTHMNNDNQFLPANSAQWAVIKINNCGIKTHIHSKRCENGKLFWNLICFSPCVGGNELVSRLLWCTKTAEKCNSAAWKHALQTMHSHNKSGFMNCLCNVYMEA